MVWATCLVRDVGSVKTRPSVDMSLIVPTFQTGYLDRCQEGVATSVTLQPPSTLRT